MPLLSLIPDLMKFLFEFLSLVTNLYFVVMFMFLLPVLMQGAFLLLMFLFSIINMGQDDICNINANPAYPFSQSILQTLGYFFEPLRDSRRRTRPRRSTKARSSQRRRKKFHRRRLPHGMVIRCCRRGSNHRPCLDGTWLRSPVDAKHARHVKHNFWSQVRHWKCRAWDHEFFLSPSPPQPWQERLTVPDDLLTDLPRPSTPYPSSVR